MSKKFLEKVEKLLPELATPTDLIKFGIAKNRNVLSQARRLGKGIPYIKLSRNRIRYPKDCVLDHLKANFHVPGKKTQSTKARPPEEKNDRG